MKKLLKWYLPSFIFCCFLFFALAAHFGFGIDEANPNYSIENTPKQKGMHVFGKTDSTNLQPLIKSNIEWITLVPFADQKDFDSPSVRYYSERRTLSRIDSVWSKKIQLAHDHGLKVFFKPHIWIFSPSNGTWRSDIFPSNEKNWTTWKKSYRDFILLYAKIAEKNNAEMFCIGTEFTRLAIEKPEFWKKLIEEVRTLDYIGIQAYFPLVKNKNPSVQQISKGWKKYFSSMKKVHKKFNKKILFTELGYKSTDDSAIEPWSWLDYGTQVYPSQLLRCFF